MPNLINPEQTNGEKKVIRWVTELCGSCKNHGSCPFIQVICDLTIMTWTEIQVSDCDMYTQDESQEGVPIPSSMDRLTAAKAKLRQQIELMEGLLKNADIK